MPLYDFLCNTCGRTEEKLASIGSSPPTCCGVVMKRLYRGSVGIRDSKSLTGKRKELWINRMDDIHKAQEDRGERLRLPHPSEVVR